MAFLKNWLVSRRRSIVFTSSLFIFLACVFRAMGQNKKPASERTIIVVGGGMAGLAAALEASQGGANVILIEGEKSTGGNSAKATSGINGCDTPAQRAIGVKDSLNLFYSDTLKAGHHENNHVLVDVLVHHASDAVSFLNQYMEIELGEVSIGGGHSVPRTHAFPMPPDGKLRPFGATVMRTAFTKLKELNESNGNFRVLMETKAEELLKDPTDSNKIIGVKVRGVNDAASTNLLADAVVLATGGYCNDHDPETSYLTRFAGDKIHFPTTNGPFADGSGMKMAVRAGAQLVDMDKIQVHPTGFVDPKQPKATTKFLAAEALRGSGAILLSQNGERFANELGLRDYLTGQILQHCDVNSTSDTHTAYMVLNQAAVDKFGRPAFKFYWEIKGFFKKVDNVDQLADLIGVDASALRTTFESYNSHHTGASIDPFGKKTFPVPFDPLEILYVGTITPVLHYSMGGVKINGRAQVLNASNQSITNLYAAGEVAGGVHGGNRLSGNSYLDCVVFGRIAGQHSISD